VSISEKEVVIQESNYFSQLATNLAIDVPLHSSSSTYRQALMKPHLNKNYRSLPPLSEYGLANTLGVAVMLYGEQGEQYFRVRDNTATNRVGEHGLVPASSGVAKVDFQSFQPGQLIVDCLTEAMEKNIAEELPMESNKYTLYPVCISRELSRCGKPQMFFCAVTSHTLEELEEIARSAKHKNEFKGAIVNIIRSPSNIDNFASEGYAAGFFGDKFCKVNNLAGFGT